MLETDPVVEIDAVLVMLLDGEAVNVDVTVDDAVGLMVGDRDDDRVVPRKRGYNIEARRERFTIMSFW